MNKAIAAYRGKIQKYADRQNVNLRVKRKAGDILFKTVRYCLVICLSFLMLLPLLTMIAQAFKSPEELGMAISIWIPQHFSTVNMELAASMLKYPNALVYTAATTAAQMLLQTMTAAFAGYAFSRIKFKGSGLLFGCVILTIIVPVQAISLPQYVYFSNFDVFGILEAILGRKVSLIGSSATLYILSFFGMGVKSGLYIYIFRQFFRGLPIELEEAAYVDGSGYIRTFFTIVLPNAAPALLTVGILSFVWNWNDTYYASLFTRNKLNLTVGLTTVYSQVYPLEWASVAVRNKYNLTGEDSRNPLLNQAVYQTGILLIILPLVVVYLFVQKKFVESVGRSGIVG